MLLPPLPALYIIIFIYTTCYSKTIKLLGYKPYIWNSGTQDSTFPSSKVICTCIIPSFGGHRVSLWGFCGFILFPYSSRMWLWFLRNASRLKILLAFCAFLAPLTGMNNKNFNFLGIIFIGLRLYSVKDANSAGIILRSVMVSRWKNIVF